MIAQSNRLNSGKPSVNHAEYHYMRKITVVFTIIILTGLLLSGCTTLTSPAPETPTLPLEIYERIGTVGAELTTWNWLFLKNADDRNAELEQLIAEKAGAEYGEEVFLLTEKIEGRWSPYSLLMLLDAAGFVEDAYMEASVWRKRPGPEPAPEPLNYGFRYAVIPEADYSGDWGFMNVEYRTREQLVQELDSRLESGELNTDSYCSRIKKLPATGKIFITLAREEITNAISRWFRFTCTWNGKTVFRKRGVEDIPYVYGTDKLWWNDMSYDVDPDWNGELKLVIDDTFMDEVFNFRIVKERYVIEE